MFQLNVSGRVDQVLPVKGVNGELIGGDVLLVERVYMNQKAGERKWNVHLGKSVFERFQKANATIKYFGFQCYRLEVEAEFHSGTQETVHYLHVSAGDFFTL